MPNTGPIPKRWLECPRTGSRLERFIPMKTPLDDEYDIQIPEENRFSVASFFKSIKTTDKADVGLWIDLTNTSRFYNRKQLEAHNCKYLKLKCRGHAETPDADVTKTFISVCDSFIDNNPGKFIVVHCTHGFNRTGFLITSYLVIKEDWSVEDSIVKFSQSRPPGIYKQEYLTKLFDLYGDVQDTFKAPVLPDWCNEHDNQRDDGSSLEKVEQTTEETDQIEFKNMPSINSSKPSSAKFMDGDVVGVNNLTEQPLLSELQKKVQKMCKWNKSGFPGAQPVSMDLQNMGLLHKKAYKVSWKADGTRYMLLLNGTDAVYAIDRENNFFHCLNVMFPRRKDLSADLENTLLDGEMILDKMDGVTIPRYLIYDIIKFEGMDVGGTDFDRRLLCIDKEIIGPRTEKLKSGQLIRDMEPFGIRKKPFWDLVQSEMLLSGKFTQELGHETDGLIFQPCTEVYKSGRCDDMLKWKPANMNSVDFKLQIVQEEKQGCLPMIKGFLYVGNFDTPFSQIKVTRKLHDYNGKIIECTFDQETNNWQFMRERTDKSYPNAYTTAIAVCNSIKHPVTTQKLFDLIKYHRFVKKTKASGDASDRALMPPPKKIRMNKSA